MMPRYDEELRSPRRTTKGHIEVWEHMGMGRLSCIIVDLCYRQLIEKVQETSRGCP
jgi:hypothetical protein